VLALRVFPHNPFAPYRTVWHRDPGGGRSIYADAPRLDIACLRYYGPACDRVAPARIELAWTTPGSFRVTVEKPAVEWIVSVARSPILAMLNPLSAVLPLATWRPRLLVQARERLARTLGVEGLELSETMPSGHHGLLAACSPSVRRIRDPEEHARLRHETDPQTNRNREIAS
jgi:hypothetical protein